MTDKEAIKQLELIAINLTNEIGTAQSEYASKLLDTYNTAQEALKEREERQKGCCYCKQKSEWGICNYYGKANLPHIILYCPMCGRNLKENNQCSDI